MSQIVGSQILLAVFSVEYYRYHEQIIKSLWTKNLRQTLYWIVRDQNEKFARKD